MAEAHLDAGGGAFVLSEKMKKRLAFRREWVSRIATGVKNLVLMQVRGDSMEPTIFSGDVVMVDKGRKRNHQGCIFALGVDHTIWDDEDERSPPVNRAETYQSILDHCVGQIVELRAALKPLLTSGEDSQ